MRRTVPVIINSSSGSTKKPRLAEQVFDALAAVNLDPVLAVVAGRQIKSLAQQAVSDGHDLVVAGGGDGTISTMASALSGTHATLGVLPLGTRNHFAKDLQIPLELAAAAQTLVAGQTALVDVGEVNGFHFVNNSSLGLYPSLVWERERQHQLGRDKWQSLVRAALLSWRHFRRVRVTLHTNGHVRIVRTPFVFVGNNEYQFEGINLGGRRALDAGHLHLCLAPDMTRGDMVRALLSALAGRLRNVKRIEMFVVSECSITARRYVLPVSLDGEVLRLETPLHFRIRPRALRVRVPAVVPAHVE